MVELVGVFPTLIGRIGAKVMPPALALQLRSSPRTSKASRAWHSFLYSHSLKPEIRSLRKIKDIVLFVFP